METLRFSHFYHFRKTNGRSDVCEKPVKLVFWAFCSKPDEANPGLVEILIVIYLPLKEDFSQD